MIEDIYDPQNRPSEHEVMALYNACPCKPEMLKLVRVMLGLSPYQVGVIIGRAERMVEEFKAKRVRPNAGPQPMKPAGRYEALKARSHL